MPFLLLQLTDSHLSADPAADYRGENADCRLDEVVSACRKLAPDGVVLTGDVAEDGSAEAYRRVAEKVKGLADRIAWLPGNHDERSAMHEVFDPAGFSAGPVLDWGGWQIVLLDSAWPGRPEGHLDKQRLAPLDHLEQQRPGLVFVHHQPMPVGAAWIDSMGLMNPETLWRKLTCSPVRAIGFGHVHQIFESRQQDIVCLSAPSTVANSVAATEKFTLQADLPRARWYRLWKNGRWESGLL